MGNAKHTKLHALKDEARLDAVRAVEALEVDQYGHYVRVWSHRSKEPQLLKREVVAARGYLSDVNHSSGNLLRSANAGGAANIEGRVRLASTFYVNDSGLVGLFTFKLNLIRSDVDEFRNVQFARPISFTDKAKWDEHRRLHRHDDRDGILRVLTLATDYTFDLWSAAIDVPYSLFDAIHAAIKSTGPASDIQLTAGVDCYTSGNENFVQLPWYGAINIAGISVSNLGTVASFTQRPDPNYMTAW
jgi:hypothetical protein